ncbi:MAG TPA: ABC transporter ATP-binding protein [Gemmatimonadaceae bacterium]|nr:ABC transporter ATP-binding protein [Gemmatimonadaceae bacterium]
MPPTTAAASLRDVTRTFPVGSTTCTALDRLSIDFGAGEFTVVMGASGSGKSTLLALLAGIDRPTSGRVQVGEAQLHAMSEHALSRWRGTSLGLVFQFFQLLPTLTALENVLLPMDFCGVGAPGGRRDHALALLEQLGVADQAHKLPSRLSGGQQQRVAVARALANDPPLLLADEPTGNLDSRTAAALLDLLVGLTASGRSVVMVTHDPSARRVAHRTVTLADGRVVGDERGTP